MALNIVPIFVGAPRIGFALLSASSATAIKNRDGSGILGTDVVAVFSASASGSRVDSITIVPQGTNVQSVITFFVNNGQFNESASNNAAFYDVTMPATTTSTNNAQGQTAINFPNGLNLSGSNRIMAATGTTVASGYYIVAYGGDYITI